MHICAGICVKHKQCNVKLKIHQVILDALTENNA